MSKPENPRVFPWCGDLNDCPTINLGMTIRDYFAAAALHGIMANTKITADLVKAGQGSETNTMWTAQTSYLLADAMLKERLK